jgi:hypothetical protein
VGEWASVVDSADGRAAIAQIGDPNASPKGECAMRTGCSILVEPLATCGLVPVEAGTVPGCTAATHLRGQEESGDNG